MKSTLNLSADTYSMIRFSFYNSVVHILILWWVLVLVWLFAIYSVSVFESFGLTLYRVQEGIRTDPTNYFYFFEQLTNVGVGIVVSILAALIPRRTIKNMKYLIFILSLWAVLLLFTPLAETYKWATAWLDLWFTNIQPGEFFKLWFVLFLGSWILRKRQVMNELTWYIWFLLITGLCYAIFVLIPDLGTVYVLAPVSLVMFWYAWGKVKYILATLFMWISAMFFAATQFTHICFRVDYYLHPENYARQSKVATNTSWLWKLCIQGNAGKKAEDIGWQNEQALLAIGWWWWIGKWYGKWLQKFWYLPEAQSDFIFAAFSEEIGVVWIGIVLALYLWLTWAVLKKLPTVSDEEDQLLAVGILSLIIMQAVINMWVNMSLLPLTWLTLPFFSHGWSALLVNMIEIVLLRKITENRK